LVSFSDGIEMKLINVGLSMGIEGLLLQGKEEAARRALEGLEQIRTQVDQGLAP